MPRKPTEPKNAWTEEMRSVLGDSLIYGTVEEFCERDAYDEELPDDEKFKKSRPPIPHLSRDEFLRKEREQQKILGLMPQGRMSTTYTGVSLLAFIRGIKHVSNTPLSTLKPSE